MTDISIWGNSVPMAWLSKNEVDYLTGLPHALPAREWVWGEIDRVWRLFNLNNTHPPSGQPIGEFYRHPVWLMNGIFSAVDSASVSHRNAIARYLEQVGARSIADYGGGFGELARAITWYAPGAAVTIIEPYPSRFGIERLKGESRIHFESGLPAGEYDAIVAQDVLEHVEDPIRLASEMAHAVREGGFLIFANCFYPVIQCHLPSTFHLRHTFSSVMGALGLRYTGRVEGATHAQVFVRTGRIDLANARRAERCSRLFGWALNYILAAMSRLKRSVVY